MSNTGCNEFIIGINRETFLLSLKKMDKKTRQEYRPHELSDDQKRKVFQYSKCLFPNKK